MGVGVGGGGGGGGGGGRYAEFDLLLLSLLLLLVFFTWSNSSFVDRGWEGVDEATFFTFFVTSVRLLKETGAKGIA